MARTKCHRSNYGLVLHRIIRQPRPEIRENLTMVFNIYALSSTALSRNVNVSNICIYNTRILCVWTDIFFRLYTYKLVHNIIYNILYIPIPSSTRTYLHRWVYGPRCIIKHVYIIYICLGELITSHGNNICIYIIHILRWGMIYRGHKSGYGRFWLVKRCHDGYTITLSLHAVCVYIFTALLRTTNFWP